MCPAKDCVVLTLSLGETDPQRLIACHVTTCAQSLSF